MTEKLLNKSIPFVHLYKKIKNMEHETINNITGNYVLLTVSLGVHYEDILNTLRNNTADYVYIDGFNESGSKRFKGLFCTDGNREIADTDSCFVVGDLTIKDKNNISNLVMTAGQLYDYMGEQAEYMLCIVVILDDDEAFKFKTKYLVDALNKIK